MRSLDTSKTVDLLVIHALMSVNLWYQLIPRNKMAAILADGIFRCILVNDEFCILIKISLKFVPKGPIDINQALV